MTRFLLSMVLGVSAALGLLLPLVVRPRSSQRLSRRRP